MIIKLSSRNQITLPREALDALGAARMVHVTVEGDRLVLTPAVGDPDTVDEAACAAWAGKFR